MQGHLVLKEGDRNTKFFHITADAHKRCNNFDQLLIQDESISEPQRIMNEIMEFFKKTLHWDERVEVCKQLCDLSNNNRARNGVAVEKI